MSLVGPRPHPVDDFERYELEDLQRLEVLPGLTGLWQVTARNDPSFERNMALDREYIGRWSLALDFRILFKTCRRGAAGRWEHSLGALEQTLPQTSPQTWREGLLGWTVSACFRPLHALMTAPALLFLFTLGVMLFRPADYRFHSYDRFAFVLLIMVVLLRSWTLRIPVRLAGPVVLPLSALLLLALYDALSQPYDPETWGVLAAKWLVPLGLLCSGGAHL